MTRYPRIRVCDGLHPCLSKPRSDKRAAEAISILTHAPWMWPIDEDERTMTLGRSYVAAGPPPMRPGLVPLVTASPAVASGSLWALGSGLATQATFGDTAQRAWNAAAAALPRCVPVLWNSVRNAQLQAPRPLFLTAHPGIGAPPTFADGASFGLAFLLSLASTVLGISLPDDLVASATIATDGSIGRVEGLDLKLQVVACTAPRLRRFMVCADQEDEARAIAGALPRPLEIVAVKSGGHALEIAFTNIAHNLAHQASDPERRDEIIDALFRLAFGDRISVFDWTPVHGAATVLADRDPVDLDASHRFRLRFAAAVAARHESLAVPLPVPSPERLAELPHPVRVAVLAHLVQHCADTATPDFADLEPLLARYVTDPHEASDAQLRLLGALARRDAVTGRPVTACAAAETLTKAWFDRYQPGEASYPLSLWLKLAGALNDPASFARADRALNRLRLLAGPGHHGLPWSEAARRHGAILLGHTTSDIFRAPTKGAYDRWSLRALRLLGDDEAWTTHLHDLLAHVPDATRLDAHRATIAAVALDEALAGRPIDWLPGNTSSTAADAVRHLLEDEPPAVAQALLALLDAQAQPTGQLLASWSRGEEAGRAVCTGLGEWALRFLPY